MSFRKLQVESLLRRTISTVLTQKLSDPRIEGMISVTKVTVSPDFHDAYIYVSVLPDKFEAKTLHGLRHASRYIHRLVADEVAMGSVPQLDFRLDHGLKKEAAVHAAIRRAREQAEAAATGEQPAPTGESPEASHDESAPAESPAPRRDVETPVEAAWADRRSEKDKSRPRQRRVMGDALEEVAKPDRRKKHSTRPRKDPN